MNPSVSDMQLAAQAAGIDLDDVSAKLKANAPIKFGVAQYVKPDLKAPSAGRKDDMGKLDMTLLDDMPRAMSALVEVMQWAIKDKKPNPYDRGSWLGVSADRYRAAILRHNTDACKQASANDFEARFERDKETNLLHLAHMACSAMMALENTLREMDLK